MFKKKYSSKLKQDFSKAVEIVPCIDVNETKNYLTELSEEEVDILDNEGVQVMEIDKYRHGIGKDKLISRIFRELDVIELDKTIKEKDKELKQKILLYEHFTFDRRLNQKDLILKK